MFKWFNENGNTFKPLANWLEYEVWKEKLHWMECEKKSPMKWELVEGKLFLPVRIPLTIYPNYGAIFTEQIPAAFFFKQGRKNLSQENFQLILQSSFIIFCTSVRQVHSQKLTFSLFLYTTTLQRHNNKRKFSTRWMLNKKLALCESFWKCQASAFSFSTLMSKDVMEKHWW